LGGGGGGGGGNGGLVPIETLALSTAPVAQLTTGSTGRFACRASTSCISFSREIAISLSREMAISLSREMAISLGLGLGRGLGLADDLTLDEPNMGF
jgi:hypothetical protein